MSTHFNTVVLTFCAWKWWTGIKSCSCWVASPTLLLHSDHCQLSGTASLSEADYFCALYSNTLFQSLRAILSSGSDCTSLCVKTNVHIFMLFGFLHICITGTSQLLEPNRHFALKMKSIVHNGFFLLVSITNTKTVPFHKQHNWVILKLTELRIFNESEEATKMSSYMTVNITGNNCSLHTTWA